MVHFQFMLPGTSLLLGPDMRPGTCASFVLVHFLLRNLLFLGEYCNNRGTCTLLQRNYSIGLVLALAYAWFRLW